MIDQLIPNLESKLHECESQLEFLGERSRPIYEEENLKVALRAQIDLIKGFFKLKPSFL